MLRSTITACRLAKNLVKYQTIVQTQNVHRWVAPTLRELRRRARLMGPQEPQPRSGFIDWNYRAELFAFSKRFHEEFQIQLLQTAFTERSYVLREQQKQEKLGVDTADINMEDNRKLAEQGLHLTKEYVETFIQHELPKVPDSGQQAIIKYLLSTSTLAHIASNLGMKELVRSEEYPPTEQTMANSLLAVIAALGESSGIDRCFLFIRDFVCTQLNQRDLTEIWLIDDPVTLLNAECAKRKLSAPEPRLIGDCGKNTVLAAYNVGIYVNKQQIGSGFGEDIPTAIKTAALDALLRMYELGDNMRPFNFQLVIEPKSIKRINTIEQ